MILSHEIIAAQIYGNIVFEHAFGAVVLPQRNYSPPFILRKYSLKYSVNLNLQPKEQQPTFWSTNKLVNMDYGIS